MSTVKHDSLLLLNVPQENNNDSKNLAKIVNGGNKYELFAMSFEWGRSFERRTQFPLTLSNPQSGEKVEVEAIIRGIQEVSEKNQDLFLVQGFIGLGWVWEPRWRSSAFGFKALYSTRTRKGTMTG